MASTAKGELNVKILPIATRKAFEYLTKQLWLKKSDWYLAGGTALALQAGHRSSVDLDFFTQKPTFSSVQLRRHLPENIFKTNILREGTVYGEICDAKISFIAYPFFIPQKKYRQYGALKILDEDDIAVMKIIAISQRGRKRDFVDLFWYCQNRKPLKGVLSCLDSQYPGTTHNYYHILKSLTYFDDAENDPMPKLFFDSNWKKIKTFFQKEVAAIGKKLYM